ncbi:hypothetical protein K4K53_008265 [Colletotrichum sp. SAR 10_77]|nr:hypothetical protein K4K51_009538 [Colletotrichum sp. SAR 10_75]KAI8219523.1 hypothetical protein K4K53_008265 [Colletotrichum sp. SAR 10_77]
MPVRLHQTILKSDTYLTTAGNMDTVSRQFIQKWRCIPTDKRISDAALAAHIAKRNSRSSSVELCEDLENARWAQHMRRKYGPRAEAAGLTDDLYAATSYNDFTAPENYRGFLEILTSHLNGPRMNANDMVKWGKVAREWIERVLNYLLKIKEGRFVVEEHERDVYLMEAGGKDVEDLL